MGTRFITDTTATDGTITKSGHKRHRYRSTNKQQTWKWNQKPSSLLLLGFREFDLGAMTHWVNIRIFVLYPSTTRLFETNWLPQEFLKWADSRLKMSMSFRVISNLIFNSNYLLYQGLFDVSVTSTGAGNERQLNLNYLTTSFTWSIRDNGEIINLLWYRKSN